MILDSIAQSHLYTSINPRFQLAFDFLKQVNKDTAPGRYDLDGDNVFAFVQQHTTKPAEEKQYEAHRKYIDVQYMIKGREVVYWAPIPLLTNITMPFTEEHDAILFGHSPEGMAFQLREQQFTILFPEDGHIPSCAWDAPAEVLKVVVKVLV